MNEAIAKVLTGESEGAIVCGDALTVLRTMPDESLDLIFGSPPYENRRTYGIDFCLKGQDWVDWLIPIVVESLRVCKGLVAFVVAGKTKDFRYSCTPELLMADLHRLGIHVRRPPIFNRVGIPGSGGPDWLRNDYEPVVCATNGGKLPWSDNTAMGKDCAYPVGGAMSNRTEDGRRRNAKTGARLHTKRRADGEMEAQSYVAPAVANPGNVITGIVGGGVMGHPLAHRNEAPFPEWLVEFFVKSFCPPGGITCDPFSGSGTTAAVARNTGRKFIAIDVRQSQCDLTADRVHGPLFACQGGACRSLAGVENG